MKNHKNAFNLFAIALATGFILSSCADFGRKTGDSGKVKVFGVFAAPRDELFGGVIDAALRSTADVGKIEYSFIDRIGFDGEFGDVLSHICQKEDAAIIIGDGFGNEEAIRASAANCPNKIFAFSQDGSSIDPNLLVFENRVFETAYLAGIVAGGSTKTNMVGVVGAKPLAQTNRMANAFIAGARFMNPNVTIRVSFNGSYFDKSLAEDAARAQIKSGVDVIYALCLGVLDAVADNSVKVINNLGEPKKNQSESVLASVVWNLQPTIEQLINQIAQGSYSANEINSFSMSTDGDASLAKLDTESLEPEVAKKVADQLTAIRSGALKLELSGEQPEKLIKP